MLHANSSVIIVLVMRHHNNLNYHINLIYPAQFTASEHPYLILSLSHRNYNVLMT